MDPPTAHTPRRYVVAGGAGFLGSHLCDALLARGDAVVAIDNLCTGSRMNLAHLAENRQFRFVEADICEPLVIDGPVQAIVNLASPASPPRYQALAIATLRAGAVGTETLLMLAAEHGCRFLHASTSEVYGDPALHPQPETYWGHVNPIGPRSMYDEAKRYAEALITAYRQHQGVDTALARIFNAYGPRMDPWDGRVVSSFVRQALTGEALTVFGDGSQTRSFCYVDDLIAGLLLLLDSSEAGPVNLGNPEEYPMAELARTVVAITASTSTITRANLPPDDPRQRCPDITKAERVLGWHPQVSLTDGLARTAAWMAEVLGRPGRTP